MRFLYRIIDGYCDGYLDPRTPPGPKMIILEGLTWVVCKCLRRDEVDVINFRSEQEKKERLSRWVAAYETE